MLPRLHTLHFDESRAARYRVRNLIKLHRRIRHFRARANASGKYDVGLYLRREWTDELDARGRQNLSDDDNAELDLSLGDKLGNNIGFRPGDFRLDGICNSETITQVREIPLPTLR